MSHQDASVRAILFTLLANFRIAVAKSVAAVIAGSGAMLADAIHSHTNGHQAFSGSPA